MTYAEKLLDPRWQKKRTEILQRDDWACQVCGAKDKTLHVHHWKYVRGNDPWDYPDGYLVTMCFECHEMERERAAWLTSFFDDTLMRSCVSTQGIADLFDSLLFVSTGHGKLVITHGDKLPDLQDELPGSMVPQEGEEKKHYPRFRLVSQYILDSEDEE